ncbi:Mannitol-1-phosphate 5-dehydrogenase like protein [Verticillium longisporum]|nr:Mannitol-1-phosphate 5-dehydrogenase like protein [Verticillium longisporum]
MAPATTKKAVHFGAGNIGRGFVACFLHNSGYEVVFADVADSLIDSINATPSYKVIEVGTEGTDENTITNYRAINSKTHEADLIEEIATADLAENDLDCKALLRAAEMAFRFQDVEEDEESKELAKIMAENGPEDVVQKVCGIQASEKIHPMLVDVVRRVQADSEE